MGSCWTGGSILHWSNACQFQSSVPALFKRALFLVGQWGLSCKSNNKIRYFQELMIEHTRSKLQKVAEFWPTLQLNSENLISTAAQINKLRFSLSHFSARSWAMLQIFAGVRFDNFDKLGCFRYQTGVFQPNRTCFVTLPNCAIAKS